MFRKVFVGVTRERLEMAVLEARELGIEISLDSEMGRVTFDAKGRQLPYGSSGGITLAWHYNEEETSLAIGLEENRTAWPDWVVSRKIEAKLNQFRDVLREYGIEER